MGDGSFPTSEEYNCEDIEASYSNAVLQSEAKKFSTQQNYLDCALSILHSHISPSSENTVLLPKTKSTVSSRTLSSHSSSDSQQLSRFTILGVLSSFHQILKIVFTAAMLKVTLAFYSTLKFFKRFAGRHIPFYSHQSYSMLEQGIIEEEVGQQNINYYTNNVTCPVVTGPQVSQVDISLKECDINVVCEKQLSKQISPFCQIQESSHSLDTLKQAACMVQSGELARLCDEALDDFKDEDIASDEESRLLQSYNSSSSLFSPTQYADGKDLSHIWDNIMSQPDDLQPLSESRTLTGTIFLQADRFNKISRSATFQPTHAKIDISKLQKNVSVGETVRDEISKDMSLDSVAALLTTGMPTIHSGRELNMMFSDSQHQQPQIEPLHLKLRVIKGPCTGCEKQLDPSVINSCTVGRYPENDFILGDPEISGEHLRLELDNGVWNIVDVGSSNGTQINQGLISHLDGRRTQGFRVQVGDNILLGSNTVILVEQYFNSCSNSGRDQSLNRADLSVNGHTIDWENYVRKHGGLTSLKKYHDEEENREFDDFVNEELYVRGAYVSQQGRDHRDKGTLKEDFVQCVIPLHNSQSISLAMLFDGHGGTEAAQQCRHSVPYIFQRNLQKRNIEYLAPYGLQEVFEETFLQADEEITDQGSGCTATVMAFQTTNKTVSLQMANVGDSSGVMLNLVKHQFRELTHDHKVVDEEESKRLDELDILRSHNGTRILGLNLARTLGDKAVKQAHMGVVAQPHVSEVLELDISETVLVLMASDGLWDVLTYEEVALVAGDKCIDGFKLLDIVEQLVDKAVARGSRDDISVLALTLGQPLEFKQDNGHDVDTLSQSLLLNNSL